MTVCDCEAPHFEGAINLAKFSSCPFEPATIRHDDVEYTVYAHRDLNNTFKGYACKIWEEKATVDSFWLGGTDTVFSTVPQAVTPMECWALIQTTSCKQHPMLKEGSTWVYEAKPEAKYRYGRTTVEVITYYFYEEVS